jgi:hypothetical protein
MVIAFVGPWERLSRPDRLEAPTASPLFSLTRHGRHPGTAIWYWNRSKWKIPQETGAGIAG